MASSGSGDALAGTVVTALLTAAIPALLAAGSLWLREWRATRSAEVRRRRDLEAAYMQLKYIAAWFDVYAKVEPAAGLSHARAWAEEVLSDQLGRVRTVQQEQTDSESGRFRYRGGVRKILLLFPLRSAWGNAVRVLFFALLVLFCSLVTSLLSDTHKSWGDRIGPAAVGLVFSCGVLYGLWLLVVRLSPDRSDPTAPRVRRSS